MASRLPPHDRNAQRGACHEMGSRRHQPGFRRESRIRPRWYGRWGYGRRGYGRRRRRGTRRSGAWRRSARPYRPRARGWGGCAASRRAGVCSRRHRCSCCSRACDAGSGVCPRSVTPYRPRHVGRRSCATFRRASSCSWRHRCSRCSRARDPWHFVAIVSTPVGCPDATRGGPADYHDAAAGSGPAAD